MVTSRYGVPLLVVQYLVATVALVEMLRNNSTVPRITITPFVFISTGIEIVRAEVLVLYPDSTAEY